MGNIRSSDDIKASSSPSAFQSSSVIVSDRQLAGNGREHSGKHKNIKFVSRNM